MTLARTAARCLILLLALAAAHPARAQDAALQRLSQLVQRGELEQAAQQADVYVRANPREPHGRFLQGVVYSRQNRIDEAIAVYTALTHDFPELPEPYNNLAALYAAKGHYEAARDALERAVRAQPSFATAHENLGDIHARLAARAYAKALELDGGRAGAREKLKAVNELVPPAPATGKP